MKPILFNTEMVRAILDGRKTQTRRVIKPQTVTHNGGGACVEESLDAFMAKNKKDAKLLIAACAPYKPGDILWIRETWGRFGAVYLYKANGGGSGGGGWRPSIHMPKEAARLFLRVTGVRAEKLQDMPLFDVWDEGTPQMPGNTDSDGGVSHQDFKYLWDSLNAKNGYGWDTNPWVWVYEFERVDKPNETV